MRPGLADFSPTVPVALAVGIGVSLSVFLLPSGVVQKGPTPVLPAFGATAGRVAADLPVAAGGRARKVAASAPPQIFVALRPPARKARQVHQPTRTVIVRRVPSPPVAAVPPAAPNAPVTKTQLFSMHAKGKAHGHGRGHGREPKAATPGSLPPGRGKALGRSNERQDRMPPGQAKKASPASKPGLPPSPKGNDGGHERTNNGDGNEGKGDGGGNGHKGEKE
jgi:hypothetical protein